MTNLYVLIGLILFLFLLIYIMLKAGKGLLKSSFLFFVIFVLLAGAFIFQNTTYTLYNSTLQAIKSFVKSPLVKTNTFLEKNFNMSIIKLKDDVLIEAPAISQMPELKRGCEVTSLTMLLQHAGVKVDKLTLAKEINKDPTPYRVENGSTYFGNPHKGFVGDIYSFDSPGLGVYHDPIKQLAEKYLPNKIDDITGSDFEELKIPLSDGRPIWVIINVEYRKLDDSDFETWRTPDGDVKITFKEHSVLVTGYDKDFVYFNDPLTGEKNKKAAKGDFEAAWIQMGRQAITYLPN